MKNLESVSQNMAELCILLYFCNFLDYSAVPPMTELNIENFLYVFPLIYCFLNHAKLFAPSLQNDFVKNEWQL